MIRLKEVARHVKMLFNFLDYGKNRTNDHAWLTFKLNLDMLKPFPPWVYEEWNERADW